MKTQILTSLRSIGAASIAATVLATVPGAASAETFCSASTVDRGLLNEVNVAISEFGSRVVAVGRVDGVSKRHGVEVLGHRAQPTVGDEFQVGDYAAVIDWSPRGTRERILEVRPLASRYVPGASEVFVKSIVSKADALRGQLRLGQVAVDYLASQFAIGGVRAKGGAVLAVRGTQPSPKGVVLGSCISVSFGNLDSVPGSQSDGSMGTGSPDGSMGTGSPDGSMGTGSPDGSMGTGSPDGSMGTGSPDGSMGTGSPDGSMGTGSPDGSMGTGSPDGSMGTGSAVG